MVKERAWSRVDSLPKCLRQLNTESWELHPGLLAGWAEPNYSSRHHWVRSQSWESNTGSPSARLRCYPCLPSPPYLLHHPHVLKALPTCHHLARPLEPHSISAIPACWLGWARTHSFTTAEKVLSRRHQQLSWSGDNLPQTLRSQPFMTCGVGFLCRVNKEAIIFRNYCMCVDSIHLFPGKQKCKYHTVAEEMADDLKTWFNFSITWLPNDCWDLSVSIWVSRSTCLLVPSL